MHRAFSILALFSAAAFVSAPLMQAQTSASAPVRNSITDGFGEKLHLSGIHNFGKVNDHLYRGAQPRSPGLRELKNLGITTIVDLRREDAVRSEWEEKRAESLGIRFVHIPVSGWSPPSDEQVAQFLYLFKNRPREVVFVHCRFGDDRTGVFIASYRIVFDNMPLQKVLKEMYYFGFNGFWHPSMAAFVKQFPSQLSTVPVLIPFKNLPSSH